MEFSWAQASELTADEILQIARIDNLIPAAFDSLWKPIEAEAVARAGMLSKAAGTDFFQVVYMGPTIAGFHVIRAGKETVAHVSTLWVHPDFRGQGLGKGSVRKCVSSQPERSDRQKDTHFLTLPKCVRRTHNETEVHLLVSNRARWSVWPNSLLTQSYED